MRITSITGGTWNIDHTQWDAVGLDDNGRAVHWFYIPGDAAHENGPVVELLPMPPA